MDLSLIFYVLIALFFGYLLFDAFGKPVGRTKPEPRSENDERKSVGSPDTDKAYEPYAYSGGAQESEFRLEDRFVAPGADRAEIEAGILEISDSDDRFILSRFMGNATRTLELMLSAYQARDREQLGLLLQDDLYNVFDSAITAAEEANDNAAMELIGLSEPRLIDAKMEDTLAVITLTTRLEQLITQRDKDGGDVDGLGETVIETSEYTFVRDVNSEKPNWYLRGIE